MRYAWVILAAAVFLIGPSITAAQLKSLRIGTNSPAIASNVQLVLPKNSCVRGALPDDAKPTMQGMQLALDDMAKDNPKARNLRISQLVNLSFLRQHRSRY